MSYEEHVFFKKKKSLKAKGSPFISNSLKALVAFGVRVSQQIVADVLGMRYKGGKGVTKGAVEMMALDEDVNLSRRGARFSGWPFAKCV